MRKLPTCLKLAGTLTEKYNALKNMDAHNQFELGREEMREQIIAFIYERYFLYNRNFFGKDSERALQMKNLIHDLRDIQAQEEGK